MIEMRWRLANDDDKRGARGTELVVLAFQGQHDRPVVLQYRQQVYVTRPPNELATDWTEWADVPFVP